MVCYVILNLDVFECCEFAEEFEILEQHADMSLANLAPAVGVVRGDILVVETDNATIVATLTIEVTA
jgi:hypothetical protein